MALSSDDIARMDAESTEGATPSIADEERIKDAYRKTIVLPAAKRHPQILICPVGLVGAGKTTVIKPLGERLGLVRISTDEIRKLLKEGGFNYSRTRMIATSLITEYLDAGYSVAVDADCAGSTRQYVEDVQKKYRLKLVWLHINPPEPFILNKLQPLKHTWLFRDGAHAVEVYLHRKPLHEHLDMPFLYVFDTSKNDVPEQIDEAIRRIEAIV